MFQNNYKELNKVAVNVTKAKNRKDAPELINETYIKVHDEVNNGNAFPKDNLEFIKWFSKYMKNNYVFRDSGFNKSRRLDIEIKHNYKKYKSDWDAKKSGKKGDNRHYVFDQYASGGKVADVLLIEDENAVKDIEIIADGMNDRTNELISIISSMSQIKAAKYIDLIEFERSLPEVEKILFDLYFRKDLSTRDIAKMYSDGSIYKINYQSINQMINTIKNKIKTHEWKS